MTDRRCYRLLDLEGLASRRLPLLVSGFQRLAPYCMACSDICRSLHCPSTPQRHELLQGRRGCRGRCGHALCPANHLDAGEPPDTGSPRLPTIRDHRLPTFYYNLSATIPYQLRCPTLCNPTTNSNGGNADRICRCRRREWDGRMDRSLNLRRRRKCRSNRLMSTQFCQNPLLMSLHIIWTKRFAISYLTFPS